MGPSLGANKKFLQGIYLAPSVVASSLKTAIFTSKMLESLSYKVSPKFDAPRADIVQTIEFGDSEKQIKFCQGIQKGSAIDSTAVPTPYDMPGYKDKVIMASRKLCTRIINRTIMRRSNKTSLYSIFTGWLNI